MNNHYNLVTDEDLSCIGDYEAVYDSNIREIINCLARWHEYSREFQGAIVDYYEKVLDKSMEVLKEYKVRPEAPGEAVSC